MATFSGTPRSDTLTGGLFSDLFKSSSGNDILDGGPGLLGRDTVSYAAQPGPVNVNLSTGSAEKFVLSLGGPPVLSSTDTLIDIESVIGSRFNDTIIGDAGSNVIAGLGGGDTIDGGRGIDTVDYSASASGVRINLFDNTASGGHANGDILISIENVIGSSSSDNDLTGSDIRNRLEGGNGVDDISGQGGDDTIIGGRGRDRLDGGEGNDTFVYSSVADSPNVLVNNDPPGWEWGDLQQGFDTIRGFEGSRDTIDLRAIDADTGQAGDQQFTIVSSFTGTAGELVLGQIIATPGDGVSFDETLLADVNGDAHGDFAIHLHWQSSPGIFAGDFLL